MKPQTYFIAIQIENCWENCSQVEMKGTFLQICEFCKKLSKFHNSDVRMSESKGYDNRGYYFSPTVNYKNNN